MAKKLNLQVDIGEVTLKNPIMAASGTFGYGEEFHKLYDISRLGAVVTKGISPKPREGNPMPRIVETPSGMLNSIGLQNVGVDAFVEEKLPFLRETGAFVIVNIFGASKEEYLLVATKLSQTEGIGMMELNISCPNVREGGIEFGVDPKLSSELVREIKKITSIPLMVKLSPSAPSIPEMACALEEAGADSLSVINTIPAMEIHVEKRQPLFDRITAGLSGPAIRPIALRMVWEAIKAVSIPVIGIGGIMTSEDALKFLIVGAKAVQIGTANFVDPFACIRILEGIEEYMEKQGIADIHEIIGSLECP